MLELLGGVIKTRFSGIVGRLYLSLTGSTWLRVGDPAGVPVAGVPLAGDGFGTSVGSPTMRPACGVRRLSLTSSKSRREEAFCASMATESVLELGGPFSVDAMLAVLSLRRREALVAEDGLLCVEEGVGVAKGVELPDIAIRSGKFEAQDAIGRERYRKLRLPLISRAFPVKQNT